jgi:hypothetical protein
LAAASRSCGLPAEVAWELDRPLDELLPLLLGVIIVEPA